MLGYEMRNVNPKNRKTGDCACRAVCVAAGLSYEDTARGMVDVMIKTGYAWATPKNMDRFLTSLGFVKHSQPKHWDGKKYKVGELDELIDEDQVAVVSMQRHFTAVVNLKIVDIWDCRWKAISNYWTRG